MQIFPFIFYKHLKYISTMLNYIIISALTHKYKFKIKQQIDYIIKINRQLCDNSWPTQIILHNIKHKNKNFMCKNVFVILWKKKMIMFDIIVYD